MLLDSCAIGQLRTSRVFSEARVQRVPFAFTMAKNTHSIMLSCHKVPPNDFHDHAKQYRARVPQIARDERSLI